MDESFLKNLNVLYVEDEEEIIELVEKRFASKFQQFVSVTSAEEALKTYKEGSFDLILTDYLLPGINGMEFAKEVLKIKGKVPIILITGYVDMQFLVEAINMGITQFVAKPIQFKLLRNAIHNAVESVVLEHLLNKSREQELELLKYKDMYNTMQHDATLKKELHIMRNDMFKKYLCKESNPVTQNGWQLEVFYKSLDIVSGDTYTCRTLNNGNILIFIADAMGKGISASITSLVSVSIVNFVIKEQYKYENLTGDTASFSMPRILYQTFDGKVDKLPSNNLPIMPYSVDVKIDSIELSDIVKVALFTDGIVESETIDKNLYSSYLDDDFASSPLLKNFIHKVNERVEKYGDDSTVFFMRRPFVNIIHEKIFNIPTRYDKIDEASELIRDEMISCNINVDEYDSFFTAVSECLMNAYEHGNLAITFDIKHELIKNGTYEEELLKKEAVCDKSISMKYVLCNDINNRYLIVSVRDEGVGYPVSVFKNAIGDTTKFNGRGIKIIDYYTDIFFFSEDRREIFIGIKVNQ